MIGVFPSPGVRAVLSPTGHFDAPLQRFTSLHSSGRAAAYCAFRGLEFKPGATVWMPAFHCGVEVQAAIDAGLAVRFYRIAPDLCIDEEDLEQKLRLHPGAVLVIHYF